jgi:large subunit ribosomal protein L5e
MVFIKVLKNKAYFKRYQTKFRRRRENKTNYAARKSLIIQDLNKYVTPKYRLVARITTGKVIAQIIYATLSGDRVVCQANSTELKKFGLKNAYTSYSAAYATGLLLSRRLLKQLKLDGLYKGTSKIDGNVYDSSTQVNESRRPFTAVLDIGIRRPTIGNRVFAVLKGATDGGIHVPHSTRKFAGYSKGASKKDSKYDPAVHKKRIYGVHIDEYMKYLNKEKPDAFKTQFSLWESSLKENKVASVEALFTKIFDEIRKNPDFVKVKKEKKPVKYEDKRRSVIVTAKGTYTRSRKLTLEERKANIEKKKTILRKNAAKNANK